MKPANTLMRLGPAALAQVRQKLAAQAPMPNEEPKRKYHNKRVLQDGMWFDSKRECARYEELKLLRRAGEITDLEVHPRYSLDVNGVHIGFYKADFRYRAVGGGGDIIEDVKSSATMTTASRLRIKLFCAIYSEKVRIVT